MRAARVHSSRFAPPGTPRLRILANRVALTGAVVAAGLVMPAVAASAAAPGAKANAVPHYSHIVVIMDNGEDFGSILHNRFAPTINRLAVSYGLASRYYTTSDPDTANIVALLAGKDFGITPWW